MHKLIAVLTLALALAACSGNKLPAGKRYPIAGEIKSLDTNTKSALIDAEKIGDWMDAMEMDYPIKPDSEFQKLHVGDKIRGTVVVVDPGYYVTDLKVVPKTQ
jgi:Cu/Ag efflux protein CusF